MRRMTSVGVMMVVLTLAGAAWPVVSPRWASAAPDNAKSRGPATSEARGRSAAATFEVYQDKSGGWRWRLRSRNAQVIATSGQGYAEKRSCMDGIESVRRAVADAPVKEVEAADKETEGAGKS